MATTFANGLKKEVWRKYFHKFSLVSSLQSVIHVMIEFLQHFGENNFMEVPKIHKIHKIHSPRKRYPMVLNTSWFAVNALTTVFLAFYRVVYHYLMHNFVILLLWIIWCELMLMNKVTSSLHIDLIRVPSTLYTQRRSDYIATILWGLVEREPKRKTMIHHL